MQPLIYITGGKKSQYVYSCSTHNQTHVLCIHRTPHTKAHCTHANLQTCTLAVPKPPCDRSEGSGANLRGSGLPASPLSSAPSNYAVKVPLHAPHMPGSFTAPRNKLSKTRCLSVIKRGRAYAARRAICSLLCPVDVLFSCYLKGIHASCLFPQ